MHHVIDTEVCVVGGGPAGSTIALRLGQLGHAVCLIEAAPFPRRRIGETLPPSILPIFEALGLRQAVEEAGFLRPESTILRWSSAGETRKAHTTERGFQVDRGRFDTLLIEVAQKHGVQLLQPASAARPQRDPRQGWNVRVRAGATSSIIHARIFVDATGRRGIGPRVRTRTSVPTLALYGYWEGVKVGGADARVEAGKDAWYWGAPLPDGSVNAAVFLDTASCAGAGVAGLDSIYREHLAQSCLLRPYLAGRLNGSVRACDATSYVEAHPIGIDFLRVGDAACALDPLSSQGVQMAMLSALQGSIALHTILTSPDNGEAAIEFYQAQQAETAARSLRTTVQLYATADRFADAPFWQQRSTSILATPSVRAAPRVVTPLSPSQCLGLSEVLRVVDTPAIVGNLIQRVPALIHPALAQPVAFLGPTALVPLLTDIVTGQTANSILQLWTQRIELRDAMRVMDWLWQMGIIIPTMPMENY